MLTGKLYLITGLSRLAVRVSRTLSAEGAEVVVVRTGGEGESTLAFFSSDIKIIPTETEDLCETLQAAGIARAACLLALSDDDLQNLQATVAAREAAPDVPVVLRAFDPSLADQLEQGLNVRRAYSVSALAAPAFVAGACGDDVLETLRLADTEIPLCRTTVHAASPMNAQTVSGIKSQFGCSVLAVCGPGAHWAPVLGEGSGHTLSAGDKVLMGGLLPDLLRLVALNGRLFDRPHQRRSRRSRYQPQRLPTYMPLATGALILLLSISIIVFHIALKLSLIDALYFVVTTATTTGYGDISLKDAPDWVKLYGIMVMLAGAGLLGILFSRLSALATAERLDQVMGQRAGRLRGHIVIAGLGNLGYRIAGHFSDLGVKMAALELSSESRFVQAIRARAPVLIGDARLPENLERASIAEAAVFIACTDNDLSNIQMCLHARRLNPSITTVARVFDDTLAERLTKAFEIDKALSATQATVGAFVGAAADESALRALKVGDLDLLACRYTVGETVSLETIQEWRESGVRFLAYREKGRPPQSPSQLRDTLQRGDEMILCGPAAAVRKVVKGGQDG